MVARAFSSQGGSSYSDDFGPAGTTWGEPSKELWRMIREAAKVNAPLYLSPKAVDRLAGALWNLGVYRD